MGLGLQWTPGEWEEGQAEKGILNPFTYVYSEYIFIYLYIYLCLCITMITAVESEAAFSNQIKRNRYLPFISRGGSASLAAANATSCARAMGRGPRALITLKC